MELNSKTKLIALLLLCLFVVSGCNLAKNQDEQSANNVSLPHDIPKFVKDKDFEKINWDKKITQFDTESRSDMVGNKDKIGFIGPELKANQVQKWLWHFWGIDKGEITVIGYNKDTAKITPVFSDAVWTKNVLGGGKINGADASMPSNVVLPESGKWALLVYIDHHLFDTLVMDINE